MKRSPPPAQRTVQHPVQHAGQRIFTLDELCELVSLPKRTVRYYIQIGLVDRPSGETRAARYVASHLEQLIQVRKWTEAGLALDRIRELMASPEGEMPPARRRGAGSVEVWSHLVVAEGVELMLEPGRAGLSPQEVRRLYREVLSVYARLRESNDA